jgi:hypothetical protein
VITPVLAAIGLGTAWMALAKATRPLAEGNTRRRRFIAALCWTSAALALIAAVVGITNQPNWRFAGVRIRLHDLSRVWAPAFLFVAVAMAMSRRMRVYLRGVPGSALAFFAALAFVAALLALGPVPTVDGIQSNLPAPYAVLYWHVPGYDGLRVPARYSTLVVLGLAVCAGFGARELRRRGRAGSLALVAMTTFFLVESTGAPIPLDKALGDPVYAAPGPVRPRSEAPDVYKAAAALPRGTVLIEFPFGSPTWDLQYVYYQHAHHLPIVNGFSGGAPLWYFRTVDAFDQMSRDPSTAWDVLSRSGASHAIVHRQAYQQSRVSNADVVEHWIVTHGGRLTRTFGDDRLYTLPWP